ncbi:MAG: hypothetical protein COB60_07875 [Flavobacteriaceae bacterium]|nr:MAG: hypothetical protein COB60_07875 [Flavobacteriaceae bacterium]
MRILKKILILEHLHKLVQMGYKGSAKDYAHRVNISRSSLFNYIDELKGMGTQIEYSSSLNSFIYLNKFVLEIKIESLSDEKTKSIFVGYTIYFHEFNYLD